MGKMITIRSQAPSCPRESEARRRTMSTIATIQAMVAAIPRSQSQSTVQPYGLATVPAARARVTESSTLAAGQACSHARPSGLSGKTVRLSDLISMRGCWRSQHELSPESTGG